MKMDVGSKKNGKIILYLAFYKVIHESWVTAKQRVIKVKKPGIDHE